VINMIVNTICIPNTVKTNLVLGKYLEKNGLPPLQKDKAFMVFSRTKKFDEVMNCIPISIKLFGKVVD